jgi:antitoxin VapB
MALTIKNPDVDRLARRAAELRETGVTEAVRAALERDVSELEKAREAREAELRSEVARIQQRFAALPMKDTRSTKEIRDALWHDVLDSH